MKQTKVLYMFLFVIYSMLFCNKSENKFINIGYIGLGGSFVKIELTIKYLNNKYYSEYHVFENEKLIINEKNEIDEKDILLLTKYIKENSIFELKSASLFDKTTTNEYFRKMYLKKFPRVKAIIYRFFLNIEGKEYSFKVDDIESISDERYLLLLKKINVIAKKPTFITTFDFVHYINGIL